MHPCREGPRNPASSALDRCGELQADPKTAMVFPRTDTQLRAVLLGNSRDYR